MGASTTGWTPAWDCAWSPGHLVAVVGLSPRLIRPKGGSGTQGSSIRVHGGPVLWWARSLGVPWAPRLLFSNRVLANIPIYIYIYVFIHRERET